MVSEHGLDPAVGTEELVDFPAKLGVDFPTQSDVGDFGDGDNYWDDGGKCANWYA